MKSGLLIAAAVVVLCAQAATALIFTGGADPIERDHGWPDGSLKLANLPTRQSWWAGPPFGTGSMYEFQYYCKSTAEFNEALEVFAAIKAKRLELVVHNGPRAGYVPGGKKDRQPDWTFTVWNAEDWDRLYNKGKGLFMSDHPNYGKSVDPPRVEAYIGGGAIVWKDVKVPEKITVIDKRPGSVAKKFAGKGLVRAKVLDIATKKPIEGAQVVIADSSRDVNPEEPIKALTDKDGRVQIAQVPLGKYNVSVIAEGYATRQIGYYGNSPAEYYQFETALAGVGAISGVVVDAEGVPIKNARVYVRDTVGPDELGYASPDVEVFTDEDGKFRLFPLPKGFASIRCRVPNMYLTNSIFDKYSVPSDNIKLVVTGTSTVRGKVYTKDWQTPEKTLHVTIRPVGEQAGKWGGSARVREDGTFEFTGVPPGDYLVGIGGMIESEEEKKRATLVSVQGSKIYEVELIQEDKK
jgi:5-hydroxyisourate hydrolase-like protein (transthyretin family)